MADLDVLSYELLMILIQGSLKSDSSLIATLATLGNFS